MTGQPSEEYDIYMTDTNSREIVFFKTVKGYERATKAVERFNKFEGRHFYEMWHSDDKLCNPKYDGRLAR